MKNPFLPDDEFQKMIERYTKDLLRYRQEARQENPPAPDPPPEPADIAPPSPADESPPESPDDPEAPETPDAEPETPEPEQEPEPHFAGETPESPPEPPPEPAVMEPETPEAPPRDEWEEAGGWDADPPLEPLAPSQAAYGTIKVTVTQSTDGSPVPGALVIVSQDNGKGEELCYVTESGPEGATERFSLPAPEAPLLLTPDADRPFYTYWIRVDKPGYFLSETQSGPVYAGAGAVQGVALVPLPDGYSGPRAISDSGNIREG